MLLSLEFCWRHQLASASKETARRNKWKFWAAKVFSGLFYEVKTNCNITKPYKKSLIKNRTMDFCSVAAIFDITRDCPRLYTKFVSLLFQTSGKAMFVSSNPSPPTHCWACVMIDCQKLFGGFSQHWNGEEGEMRFVPRIRIFLGILSVTISRILSKCSSRPFTHGQISNSIF